MGVAPSTFQVVEKALALLIYLARSARFEPSRRLTPRIFLIEKLHMRCCSHPSEAEIQEKHFISSGELYHIPYQTAFLKMMIFPFLYIKVGYVTRSMGGSAFLTGNLKKQIYSWTRPNGAKWKLGWPLLIYPPPSWWVLVQFERKISDLMLLLLSGWKEVRPSVIHDPQVILTFIGHF